MIARRLTRAAAIAATLSLAGCGFRKEGLGSDEPTCFEDCGPSTDSAADVATDGPPDDTPVPPGTTVTGDFVGAVVTGSAAGIELHGSMHWSSAVSGSNAGITLVGTLE